MGHPSLTSCSSSLLLLRVKRPLLRPLEQGVPTFSPGTSGFRARKLEAKSAQGPLPRTPAHTPSTSPSLLPGLLSAAPTLHCPHAYLSQSFQHHPLLTGLLPPAACHDTTTLYDSSKSTCLTLAFFSLETFHVAPSTVLPHPTHGVQYNLII